MSFQVFNLVFAIVALAFIGWVQTRPGVSSWLTIVLILQAVNVAWQILRLAKYLT